MNRTRFHSLIATSLVSAGVRGFGQESSSPSSKFEPLWDSLNKHAVPEWFRDAKFGIFIHWGLYSVPAWAPPTGELGKVDWTKWFIENPYAEWYLNSLRIVVNRLINTMSKPTVKTSTTTGSQEISTRA